MSESAQPGPLDVKNERDEYLKSLYSVTREKFAFTEEELQNLDKFGLTLTEIIEQIEKRNGN